MASQKKKPGPADEMASGGPTANLSPEEEFTQYVEELGDSITTVAIHRVPRVGGKMEWCNTVTLDQATLEQIRENYGPGQYRLTFRGATGYLGTKAISIAAPYVRPDAAAPSHQVQQQQPDSLLRELLPVLIANLSHQSPPPAPLDVGALLAGLGALRPTATDPAAMLTAIVTAVAALRGADGGGGGGAGGVKGALETIAIAKELVGGGGGGSDMDGYLAVGGKLLDAVGSLLAQRRQASAAPGVPVDVARGPAVALPPAGVHGPAAAAGVALGGEGATIGSSPEEVMRQWITVGVATLKEKARQGKDVEFWAEYIEQNQDEEWCRALLLALDQGATLDHLLAFDAEIAQDATLKAWFGKLYDELLPDGLPVPVDTAGPSRDVGNVGTNAESGDGSEPASPGVGGRTGKPGGS